jgi:hypothetical protein
MFPASIRVADPLTMSPPGDWAQHFAQLREQHRYWATLGRSDLFELWQGLFDKDQDFCSQQWLFAPNRDDSKQIVADWICGRVAGVSRASPDGQIAAWQTLKAALR